MSLPAVSVLIPTLNGERDLARLVLAVLDTLRQVMEREAIRRMEAGSLTVAQEERLGLALMRAEARLAEIAAAFGLAPDDLVLDLGLGGCMAGDHDHRGVSDP